MSWDFMTVVIFAIFFTIFTISGYGLLKFMFFDEKENHNTNW